MSKTRTQDPKTTGGYEWLTQIAFILALALVVARATIRDFSGARGEPLISEAPRGAEAATSMALDLLSCLPAILVLARRVSDREYILRWSWSVLPLAILAIWGTLSVLWSANKFAALIMGFHVIAALALLWAGLQLVRSWLRLRIVASVMFGLLLAYFTHSLFYRLIDLPDLKANWEKDKKPFLQERGWADDPFLAKQFENRVLAGELMGFFTSPNSMGAMVVLLMVISIGVAAQRLKDDPRDRAGLALLLAIPIGAWMILYTRSRTAAVTSLLALGMLVAAWRWRESLARRSRQLFWIGVCIVILATAAVIAHGHHHQTLFHTTLTFRWQYWVGAMRIFVQHPLTGVGLDNFNLHYLAVRLPEASEEIKDPHNFLVRFLVELGIIGGICCVAWIGRLAWELTRPVNPPQPAKGAAAYRGARVLLTFAMIAVVSLLINVFASVDLAAKKEFIIFETFQKISMFALFFIGASLASIKSLSAPELDARPAPLVLYAILAGLAVFLVHNLIDFSLFEPGPMMVFALLAGSALGVRQPSLAGQKKRTASAAVALAACIVLWLVVGGFVWIPAAIAADAANDAAIALRTNRPNEAVRILNEAREHQPLNADYPYRAAQVIIATSPVYNPPALELLALAIKTNPLAPEYHLTRARYLLQGPDAQSQRNPIIKDFQRALELNPNDVSTRIEFADALSPFDKPQAIKQYKEALKYNNLLKPDEPKRLRPEKVAEIEKKIATL